jgi:hypothetical protein
MELKDLRYEVLEGGSVVLDGSTFEVRSVVGDLIFRLDLGLVRQLEAERDLAKRDVAREVADVMRLNERQERQIGAQRRMLRVLLRDKLTGYDPEYDFDVGQLVADLTILVEEAVGE